MKLKQIIQRPIHGSVTTYVLILFGLTVSLYMFNFTNTASLYLENSSVENINITDPSLTTQGNPIAWIIELIGSFMGENLLLVVGGVGGIITAMIIGWVAHIDLSIFYSYIIPIAILGVFLNLVIFPIQPISNELATFTISGISLSTILVIMFNLFFILAIIEYIRGTNT